MTKVLWSSRVDDSLIGNLCRPHVLLGKVPGNIKYVNRKNYMLE